MWSHYSDDSSGFVEVFDGDVLKENFDSLVAKRYPTLNVNQRRVLTLQKLRYGEKRDCSELIKQFILHRNKPGKKSANRFLKYVGKTGDYESVIYILTNKMREWEYEREWRMILPRATYAGGVGPKRKTTEDNTDYRAIFLGCPKSIVAGETIKKENLAALAYFCERFFDEIVPLYIQKRTSLIYEKHLMEKEIFKPDKHLQK